MTGSLRSPLKLHPSKKDNLIENYLFFFTSLMYVLVYGISFLLMYHQNPFIIVLTLNNQ
jgi:hypothetical protein